MSTKNAKVKVEDVVMELAAPICEELGCEVFEVEYKKEGSDWFLRVYIDREEPVDHDLCYAVSQKLSDVLDEKDPIASAYFLEVSSPGIERPLRKAADYERFKGELIMVKLFAARDGKKEYAGYLLGLENDIVSIEAKEKNKSVKYEFVLTDIAKAHLLFDFKN